MTYLARLKAATTLNDVAALLGVKPSALAYVLYKIPAQNKYKTFKVPKKSGGERVISAPDERLKLVQRRLGKFLEQAQAEIEAKLKVKKQCLLAHGFKTGLSIATNATNHRNRRWVFNTDLQDFFPSINFGRVYGFFMKNQHYMLNKKVATIIAQIACHENQLPQGSPCSPTISNIIAHLLDIRLNELAAALGCTYTRYADDLTFSTNKKAFPSRIAKRDPGDPHAWVAGSGLRTRVGRTGFAINAQKTRMQYCDSRQDATGLVVNQKVNVRKEYYKLARAMCRELVTKGAAFERVGGKSVPVDQNKLRGMLAFIYHIKCWDEARRDDAGDLKKRCFHRVYADFLNYVSFYGLTQPTIVCEGKTDNVYLRCALRSLAEQYPALVQVHGQKKTLLLRLFKFTETTKEVQGLSGGASQLSTFLSEYRTMIQTFAGVPTYPTILIVDNDSGPKQLFQHLTNVLKKSNRLKKDVDGSDQYYHAYENLYVVPVPKVGGAFTAMEQLFEPKVLETKLDGRALDLTNRQADGKKFYSKNEFSIKVIQENQANISFDGFKPLLDAIVAVKTDYTTKIGAVPRVAA